MSAELKKVQVKALAASAVVTADGNGAAFDLRPYDGAVKLALSSTAGTGNMTLDVKIQHSADNSTWTDSGVAFSQVTTAASFQELDVTAEQFKRYIRAVDDVGGTTPSFARTIVFVGKARA